MITEKAISLSRQAKEAAEITNTPEKLVRAQEAARAFFDELFENCEPTEQEFSDYTSGIMLSGRSLWKMCEYLVKKHTAKE